MNLADVTRDGVLAGAGDRGSMGALNVEVLAATLLADLADRRWDALVGDEDQRLRQDLQAAPSAKIHTLPAR